MGTMGRDKEISGFCQSLLNQHYPINKVLLIVIDQNEDNRVEKVLAYYKSKINIKHIKTNIKGLSRARNIGIRELPKDINVIGFPDDDCLYPADVLQIVSQKLSDEKLDGITGISYDIDGSVSSGNFNKYSCVIDFYNVWNSAISYTVFLKREVVEKVGFFDEELGVGAPTIFKSGEETDYLIRILKKGFKLYYTRSLKVFHPNKILKYDTDIINRSYYYGCGWGKVLQKHKYPLWFKVKSLIRPLGGAVLCILKLNTSKSYYHFNTFLGRLKGILS